ncbi:esterase-like activity of phytase family protein [Micromonospora sp. WMMD1120]|uniref:esterase-like activity of phytase family protein n=1 Tax=Micromonospora sp. WMMD1120 TaxID=3016106 RepID=UPI0024176ADF|nr:esterase-like activity of phytase family protein [Micromonospora sp. WMMD1120]MDG4810523.1 esterase-like activity of phytase family protein [Micromonospora sp. WMMD1120]
MRTTSTGARAVAAAVVAISLLAAAPALGAPAPESPQRPGPGASCAPDAALLGFTDALDKTSFRGQPVAGLSALAPTRPGRALALVDNIGATPARVFGLGLENGRHGVRAAVRDVTVLTRPDGTPYTGVDFDGEGLVAERGGATILASSEREPSIRRFRLSDGREVASLPVPERFRVTPAGGAAVNQTFEALAGTPDHRTLYAGMEGPLAEDGRDAAGRGLNRIIRYDGREGGAYAPGVQYAYRTDSELGLVELIALGGDQLLAVERGFTTGVGNTVRVYRVSATGAPDVSGVPSLSTVTDPRAWLGKELLVDLVTCPPSGATTKQPQPNPLLDNIEGAALGGTLPGGRRELFLVSDDNGSATQTTRVYALSVRLRPEVTLRERALLSATAYQPGPVSGTQLATAPVNGISAPFPGQPIPGFSAVIPARPGDRSGRRLLAMPDNGFGAKTNSADFLLRAYEIEPDYPRRGVNVRGHISFRDPDHRVPFPIVNENTADRLLTGADFDIESLARGARGDLWIGDEFGPYLVHVDRTGKVLQAPIPLPDGTKSPQSPDLAPGETPTVRASNGFEAMAASEDGWTLYPILEGARVDDPDQRRRVVYEFDVRRNRYTGRTWSFRVDDPSLLVGDAAVLDGRRLLLIERDNGMGPQSLVKRLVVTDLDEVGADGYLKRRTAVDLMRVADPTGVSTPARPGEYGVGPLFSFPLQSVESVLPLGGDRVLVANDNNFPGNDGRIPGRADDTELIVIGVPGLR